MNKFLKLFIAFISSLLSFSLCGYSFYLSYLNNYWFITIGIYFFFEGLFIWIPLFIKDGYKAMRIQGVFQILGVILMMDYLLVMSLWNDPNGTMLYFPYSYLMFGIGAVIKLITALVSHIGIKKEYNPLLHAYRNNDLITAFYFILILELTLMNQYYPGESVNIFNNLFQQKPIWVYIIDVALNATFTVLAALLALSTDIRSKTKENLSTVGKIKHTINWFNEKEVAMFFGLIFTLYLATLAFLNMKQHWFYIFLGSFYLGTATIRFINYIWHKGIQKKCGENKIRENRLSSWILFFNAFAYFIFSWIITTAAIFLMTSEASVGKNIYLFLFIIVPFGIMRFINAIKGIRTYRRENDTYRLGISYISLISAFFSLLEIAAITTFYAAKVLKYLVVTTSAIILHIVVLVICVTFIVHFIRSLIINRSSKEH